MISVQKNDDFNFRRFMGKWAEEPYFKINREERHLAAILFHLLARPGNVPRLLQAIQCDWAFEGERFEVYFEYSYVRDIWNVIEKTSAERRDAIRQIMEKNGVSQKLLEQLASKEIEEFNGFFVGKKNKNPNCIQSPATWRLLEFGPNIVGNGPNISEDDANDLVVICKIKWAFRIKPDLVVQDRKHALCIELKLEAGEGSYPSVYREKDFLKKFDPPLFGPRKTCKFPVRQSTLQRFMMEELLGFESHFLLVTRTDQDHRTPARDSHDHQTKISWPHLRCKLDYKGLPPDMLWAWEHAGGVFSS